MVLSSIGIVLDLLSLLLGDRPSVTLISGIIVLFSGYLLLTKPYFYLSRDSLFIYNLFGKPIKHYSFDSLANLEVIGNKIYYLDPLNDRSKKFPINKYMIDRDDWEKILLLISEDKPAKTKNIF